MEPTYIGTVIPQDYTQEPDEYDNTTRQEQCKFYRSEMAKCLVWILDLDDFEIGDGETYPTVEHNPDLKFTEGKPIIWTRGAVAYLGLGDVLELINDEEIPETKTQLKQLFGEILAGRPLFFFNADYIERLDTYYNAKETSDEYLASVVSCVREQLSQPPITIV